MGADVQWVQCCVAHLGLMLECQLKTPAILLCVQLPAEVSEKAADDDTCVRLEFRVLAPGFSQFYTWLLQSVAISLCLSLFLSLPPSLTLSLSFCLSVAVP